MLSIPFPAAPNVSGPAGGNIPPKPCITVMFSGVCFCAMVVKRMGEVDCSGLQATDGMRRGTS